MARSYMQQAPAPIAPAVPIPLVQTDPETGLKVAYQMCPCGCGQDVKAVYSPRLAGSSVEECARTKRDRRAKELLVERRSAIREKVAQRLISSEQERLMRAAQQAQKAVEALRASIIEKMRDEDEEQYLAEEEAKELGRIVAELTSERRT